MGKRRIQDSPMIVLSQGPTGPFSVPLLLLMPCWDWRCCARVTKALGYLPQNPAVGSLTKRPVSRLPHLSNEVGSSLSWGLS